VYWAVEIQLLTLLTSELNGDELACLSAMGGSEFSLARELSGTHFGLDAVEKRKGFLLSRIELR
jgi:hypothetical protein